MTQTADRHVVVVDGSNLATEGRTTPSLRQLDEAVQAYAAEDPGAEIVVVVDASFEHRIDPSERNQLVEAELHGEVVSPPAGAIGRGDAFVLRIAERTGAKVLSNDSFQEFHAEHPWLFDDGRLIGGKPVPGVGWIFTPRIPVRGPKSRQATGKAKRATEERLTPPAKAAELAKAAKKAAARRVPLPSGGPPPKVGDVWPPVPLPAAEAAPAEQVAGKKAAASGKKAAASGKKAAASGKKAAGAKKAAAKEAAPLKAATTKKAAATTKNAATTKKAAATTKVATAKKAAPAAAKAEAATKKAAPAAAKAEAATKKAAAATKKDSGTGEPAAAKSEAAPKKPAGARKAAATKKAAAAKRGAGAKTAPEPASSNGKRAAGDADGAGAGGPARSDPALRLAIDEAMAEVLAPASEADAGAVRSAEGGKKPKADAKGHKRRRRRTGALTPAVNEPLAFITFVATYPLQSEVAGEVVSFTSHGAMVDVDLPGGVPLHCYIPLSAMGDPPPTKARQVLTRGERRSFVLVGLDPPRRVAELALPGVPAAAGAPA